MPYLPNPYDALQEPCQRWLRCQYLCEYRLLPTPKDDAITRDAYAFLCAWRRCRDDAQREHVAQAHPALAEAHRLYQSASLQRAEVEARLLAGQDDDSIAGKCNLTSEVIHLFHALFFDVRPYLSADIYIFNIAIGRKVHHGLQPDDYDVLLKLAGYALGALGVDELLAYWAEPPVWPVSFAQLDDAALETLGRKLRMQAWILSLIVPADAATAARLPAIRALPAQAGVLGKATGTDPNSALSIVQTPLDYRAFLTEAKSEAFHTAKPQSQEVVFRIEPCGGLALPGLPEQQAVPA